MANDLRVTVDYATYLFRNEQTGVLEIEIEKSITTIPISNRGTEWSRSETVREKQRMPLADAQKLVDSIVGTMAYYLGQAERIAEVDSLLAENDT